MLLQFNRWMFIICLVVCLILTTSTFAFAAQTIQVYVDGTKINFNNNPTIENGTTLVEFRPIFEKLGLQVGWDNVTQTVTGEKDGLSLNFKIGSKAATVNGNQKQLLVAPKILNGYTMVPLRFIGESTGKNVKWDEQSKTINILTGGNSLNTVSPNISTSSSNLSEIKTLKLANDDYNFAFFNDGLGVGISQEADNDGTFKGYLIGIKNFSNSPLKINQISFMGLNKISNSAIEPSNALYSGKLGAYKLQSTYNLEPSGSIVGPIIFMSNESVHAIRYNDYFHQVVLDIPHIAVITSNNQSLLDAVNNNNSQLARKLLESGVDPNIKNTNRETPLFIAAYKGYIEIVKVLLSYGADINIKDKNGYTPLLAAKAFHQNDVVKILQDAAKTVNIPRESEIVMPQETITTAYELRNLLEDNFSEVYTSIGLTNFTFDIIENGSNIIPYDYWIQVRYESSFFTDIQYSNNYTDSEREKVRRELKEFMDKMARFVIEVMPNKKFYGCYYDSWYRYPNLKVDLITRKYYNWKNFSGPIYSSYNDAKKSSFNWDNSLDDEL